MKVNIEVSARHIHLSEEDCRMLFGVNKLEVRNNLSEKGEFASTRTVEVVGPDDRLKHVRVLGPLRKRSQLEISKTDAVFLGIDAPLTLSGSGKGEKVRVIGEKGEIISDIAMIAKRHFHTNPEFAQKHKLKDGSLAKVKINGDRSLIFDNVVVRISSSFVNNIHIDTDEGNAAGINGVAIGELIIR